LPTKIRAVVIGSLMIDSDFTDCTDVEGLKISVIHITYQQHLQQISKSVKSAVKVNSSAA
jgi:hypothetical protein